jgi:hypothetical protein
MCIIDDQVCNDHNMGGSSLCNARADLTGSLRRVLMMVELMVEWNRVADGMSWFMDSSLMQGGYCDGRLQS